MLCYNWDTLGLAECFAFNPGGLGMALGVFGSMVRASGWESADRMKGIRMFHDFYAKYKHYQTKARSLANVAVLRHTRSMVLSGGLPYLAAGCVEQLLQEAGIPFRIIFSEQLRDLSGVDLIIIPAMPDILDAEAEMIGRLVAEKGLSLLLLKEVGIYDDYSRTRSRVKDVNTLEDLVQAFEIGYVFAPLTGEDFSQDFVKQVGKGKVGFVKELEFVEKPGPQADRVSLDCINKPKNNGTILSAIKELLAGKELFRVAAEGDLAVDILKRIDTGEGVIQLLNVSFLKDKKVSAKVWFRWPDNVQRITEVRYNREPVELPFTQEDSGYAVQVKDIEELSTLIIA